MFDLLDRLLSPKTAATATTAPAAAKAAITPSSSALTESDPTADPISELPIPAIPESSILRSSSSDLTQEEFAEYQAVCADLGMTGGAFLELRLTEFLRAEGIRVYDNDQVVPYLDKVLGKEWKWMGLRPTDVGHLSGWNTGGVDGGPRKVEFANKPYTRAIPLPVLLTARKIMQAFPGEVYFYVSGTEADGDPFLAVTSRTLEMFVVERWNEPGYRER